MNYVENIAAFIRFCPGSGADLDSMKKQLIKSKKEVMYEFE